ncbi:MAG: hypothetical protein KF805_17035 [Phycisphaeraceae bacterium]|nr:hypothetical protein [Phycisphaeraceae bacterium]
MLFSLLTTLADTEFGVRELLLAGGALGIGVLLVGWGFFSRKREVPGHARDGAERLTRELIDELEARAERLERLIERAETTITELRENEQRAAARPASVIAEAKMRNVPTPEPSIFTDPVHREVCAMADDGLSAVDIARRLQMPTGQVELILNLRGKRVAVRN